MRNEGQFIYFIIIIIYKNNSKIGALESGLEGSVRKMAADDIIVRLHHGEHDPAYIRIFRAARLRTGLKWCRNRGVLAAV